SIQNDTVHELGENSEHMTGMLFSIWTTVTKLAFAVAIGLSFILLELVSFDANNPNETGLLMLALLYGLFPVVFKGLAIVMMLPTKRI
ncbi:MAG TPA: MFS transporter, partial [Bacteroidetes bacterium]|nr:MFS transporter [Bacteroidota bacterium]